MSKNFGNSDPVPVRNRIFRKPEFSVKPWFPANLIFREVGIFRESWISRKSGISRENLVSIYISIRIGAMNVCYVTILLFWVRILRVGLVLDRQVVRFHMWQKSKAYYICSTIFWQLILMKINILFLFYVFTFTNYRIQSFNSSLFLHKFSVCPEFPAVLGFPAFWIFQIPELPGFPKFAGFSKQLGFPVSRFPDFIGFQNFPVFGIFPFSSFPDLSFSVF